MKKFIEYIQIHRKNIHLAFGLKNTLLFTTAIGASFLIVGDLYKSLVCGFAAMLYLLSPERRINCSPIIKLGYIWSLLLILLIISSFGRTFFYLELPINLLLVFTIILMSSEKDYLNDYKFYYSIILYSQIFGIVINDIGKISIALFISLLIGIIYQDIIFKRAHIGTIMDFENLDLVWIDLRKKFLRVKNNILKRDFIFVFSLKLAITTSICLYLYTYFNIPFFSWLIFSLCYTLIPNENQIVERANKRVIGTIFGALIFITIRLFVSNIFILSFFAVIAFILYISYIPQNRLYEQFVMTTYLSLYLRMTNYSIYNLSFIRVSYVVIGALTALFITKILTIKSDRCNEQEIVK